MRTVVAALLGLIGGVIVRVAISEIIGIVGYLVFYSAVEIKFIPIHLAILFAVVALVVDARLRRRSEQPSCRLNQRSK
jgi:membrane protein implicated in regulation of membrane protease activity